jgi:Asp-tRNA(Asn)/Glu-tRNA(Gln) amidotransferase B subunit
MTHELLGQLGARKETFTQNPVSIEQMGELIDMVQDGSITGEHILQKLILSALTLPLQERRVKCYYTT